MDFLNIIMRNQDRDVAEFREKDIYLIAVSMFWVGFLMVIGFNLLDRFLLFENQDKLLKTRLITAGVELFLLVFLVKNKKHPFRIKIISFIVFGVLSIYSAFLTYYSGGWGSVYWAGFNFCLIFMLCLWPVSVLESTIFTMFLILIYNITLIVLIGSINIEGFLLSNIFIFGTELIGVTVSFINNKQTLILFTAVNKLNHEKEKSENLLLNILPVHIADRLKSGEITISDYYDKVAILFADIVGFTSFCSNKNSNEIVTVLNEIFFAFDTKTEELGLEKIKTIGDGYLVMGGGLKSNEKQLLKTIALGDYMIKFMQKYSSDNNVQFSIRVGI
jgi:hypothetical protein